LRVEPLEGRWVPATITPTTFADGGLGSGSLRDAVLQFNADTGTDDDIIQLLPGTYTLTIPNGGGRHETAGLTGDLNLTQTSHRWIIQGTGPSTVIDASQLQDRVFQIVNPGTQVFFQNLVIQGGLAQENGADGAQAGTTDALGGGVFDNGGAVTLDNVVLQNNLARGGNALYNGDAPGFSSRGGGLYSTGGSLTISNSTMDANAASGGTGAYDDYDACISDCSFPGGTGGASQGGGLYVGGSTLTLINSTIAANTLHGGTGGGSRYGIGGAGGAAQGSGLWLATGATAHVSFNTIATNQATGGSHGSGPYGYLASGPATGGGLYNQATLQTSDTILARNTVTGPGTNTSPDLAGNLGSLGYNLIGNSQGGTGFDLSDLLGVDPRLGPLQDNGGPTPTMALLPDSPAIDAGDPNFVGPPDWDQRGEGFPRISNGRVDIGAFEVQQGQIPSFSVTDFPSPVTAGEDGTFTVTALDADGNLDPTYTGTVHFISTDPRAQLPDDYTFTPDDQGVHTFDATFETAGTWDLIVRDTVTLTRFGRQTGIVVLPGAADHYTLSAPAIVAGDSPFAVTLTVLDAFGNQATGYQGTVHFSSTDPQATLPDDYTFTAADRGSHRFSVTLHSAGQQTLTVQDTVNGALSIDHDVHVSRTVWLVTSFYGNSVLRYDSETGAYIDTLVTQGAGGLIGPHDAVIGPDGNVYVTSRDTNEVLRYDRTTGAFLGAFVTRGSGGLNFPHGLLFRDGYLYVSSTNSASVLRYDATTGAFIDAFVSAGSGGLKAPTGLLFGPDGNLYVNSQVDDSVLRYDGMTGAPLPAPGRNGAVFVPSHSGGLLNNYGQLDFGPDGNLYVASDGTNNVLRYDGTTGEFLGVFVPAGSGGLNQPEGLVFGPDGRLYVASGGTNNVLRYDGNSGAFLGVFTGAGGSLMFPAYITYWDMDAAGPGSSLGGPRPHSLRGAPLNPIIGDLPLPAAAPTWTGSSGEANMSEMPAIGLQWNQLAAAEPAQRTQDAPRPRIEPNPGPPSMATRRQARDGLFAGWAAIGDWESVFTPTEL
jgi:streptogramin lyase